MFSAGDGGIWGSSVESSLGTLRVCPLTQGSQRNTFISSERVRDEGPHAGGAHGHEVEAGQISTI